MSSLPPAVTLIKQDEHPALSESRNRAERPTDRIYVAPPEIVLVALPFSFLLFFLFPPTTHVGGKKKKKKGGGESERCLQTWACPLSEWADLPEKDRTVLNLSGFYFFSL